MGRCRGWRKCGRDIPPHKLLLFRIAHARMGDTSLSSVVSGLVRAQMGTSVSSSITDEDLDRHVAELILKEAKKKAEQYGQQGISAYLPQFVELSPFLSPLRIRLY
jgi:ethanolamine ammonia-lyase small subunit